MAWKRGRGRAAGRECAGADQLPARHTLLPAPAAAARRRARHRARPRPAAHRPRARGGRARAPIAHRAPALPTPLTMADVKPHACVSRTELLAWVNDTLGLSLTKIEQAR